MNNCLKHYLIEHLSSNKSTNMRHIHHEQGVNGVRYLKKKKKKKKIYILI